MVESEIERKIRIEEGSSSWRTKILEKFSLDIFSGLNWKKKGKRGVESSIKLEIIIKINRKKKRELREKFKLSKNRGTKKKKGKRKEGE